MEDLIEKCKEIVESEGEKIDDDEYVNETDPSILRFLLASRQEVCCIFIVDVYHAFIIVFFGGWMYI